MIVEMLDQRWRERSAPRAVLVRDITTLYAAMSDSLRCYEDFCTDSSEKTRKAWDRHVGELLDVVRRVDPTLEIFAPGIRPVLRHYAVFESLGVQAAFLTREQQQSPTLLPHMPQAYLEFYSRAFYDAQAALRSFMQGNFSVEEVHAALRK
ncbi:hypothetical protein [uncultured Jatrophihabitans sp.]|uniref:hypothetical protein n=1 Tax=uncultured Jatrophihabitans sp. TaxID=1610747 RepID=UPI0035CB7F86